MVELDAVLLAERQQFRQIVQLGGTQNLACPQRRVGGARPERLHRDLAAHDQVVIAGQQHVGALTHDAEALGGAGVVADHIAKAPDLGGSLRIHIGEHGLEGGEIRVDV